ncbi:MAG TPA: prolyl oligopeptidase family serine peptidase [Chitinophagaceae bacterium]|nr:prolyl oligopeptidase family serine peptidase [Chitinophagaceae bacterium]
MKKLLLPFCMVLLLASCKNKDKSSASDFKPIEVKYPVTEKDITVKDNYFGTIVADPYRWLENDTSAKTANWVKAENEVTQGYLKQIPFREAIRKRYETLFNYEKYSAPFKEGKYTYYYKNSGLQNQSELYRESDDGKQPEVFLDPNSFSKDSTTSLAGIDFSKDGSMAAYNISIGGSDWQKLVVINAVTQQQTGDTLDIKFSGASWKGNDGFYYSTYPRPKEGSFLAGVTDNQKLYYHKLGTPQKDDKLIFGDDKKHIRYVSGGVTEDEKWLMIYTANETYGNGLYVLDLTKPNAKPVALVGDMKNSHGIIDNDDQYFYIQTDRNAPTGKVVTAPVTNPVEANWKTIIDVKPEVLNSSSAGQSIFCSYLKDAVSKVYQYDRTGKQIREIPLPGIGTARGFSGKQDEIELYYSFTSYINPPTIYKLNIESGKSELYKQPTVQFNPEDYESKQVFYNSKDGTKIPMIITYKKGTELNGKNPCLLYAYGGFSISITPSFNTSNIILLENGGIYAVPNIRGGGEYGEAWHEQGIKMKKQNVFDDFMAAAQYLVDNKYTSRDMLAIEGGSNGGLLIGACITQQPGMCKVAFPEVGVMDMLRYNKFTAGAGWAYDYGTSSDSKEMFEYLYKYSPLHNIHEAEYPATLISTADHDDRVVPAHSFKFAATMQEKQKGANPVLIRIETRAGHGIRNTQQVVDGQTDKWSFMFYNMGIKPSY